MHAYALNMSLGVYLTRVDGHFGQRGRRRGGSLASFQREASRFSVVERGLLLKENLLLYRFFAVSVGCREASDAQVWNISLSLEEVTESLGHFGRLLLQNHATTVKGLDV